MAADVARRRRLGWLGLACVLLNGCATHAPKQPLAAEGWPLLAPASLAGMHAVKQTLRGAFGDQEFQLQSAITADAGQVTVIGVTVLGLRAFTLKYDGEQLHEERAAALPALINGRQLLNDVQLAFWPLPALQTALHSTGWEVSEPYPGTRRLQKQGRLMAEVHYADVDPWNGRLWLSNFVFGYSLFIESSPAGAGAK